MFLFFLTGSIILLNCHMQYRMCADIMELSNALIYGNRLQCGSPEIENSKLTYRGAASAPEWLNQVFNSSFHMLR